MRIAVQVWLCIAAVAVGWLATVALTVVLGWRNQTLLEHVASVAHPAALRCQQAAAAFEQGSRAFELAVVFGDAAQLGLGQERCEEAVLHLSAAALLPRLDAVERTVLDSRARHLAGHTHRAVQVYKPLSEGRDDAALREAAVTLSVERSRLREGLAEAAEGFSARLRRDIAAAVDSAADQRRTVLLACLGIIAVAFSVAAVVMRGWTQRMAALLGASDRLAAGDYDAGLPEASGDEVGRLVLSFAAMREAVESRDRELRLAGEGLELTVAERTRELADRNAMLSAEIGERERAERSLRLLESAVGQIGEGVVLVAIDGDGPTVIWTNRGFRVLNGLADGAVADLRRMGADAEAARILDHAVTEAAHGREAAALVDCRRGEATFPAEWHLAPVRGGQGAVAHVVAIQRDISERRRAEAALAEANRRSLEASREAGRAEIATSVLHNVGNVLNSVNVSVTLLHEALAGSRAGNLARAAALLQAHQGDLARFLVEDERGRVLPGYLVELGARLAEDTTAQIGEVRRLAGFVGHIKDVIAMQQGYARTAGVRSPCVPEELCEDALRVHAPALERLAVAIERRYAPGPPLMLDRSRVLQILINLIGNARNAVEAGGQRRVAVSCSVADGRLRLAVADEGVGIAPDVMPRLFTHGFTTRPDGHGFGLHASALAARELGGTLSAASDGPGTGAVFTLDIPAERSPA